ncbi:MAG: hypothetical protein K0S40_2619 [Actinomycetospora sp.]|nr:hypothetical protein [Actinomycetospora sp.]
MGVPEQLRRLDEDLATGRVDAESYRRRRDELLAARLPAPPTPPAPPVSSRHDPASADADLDDSELDAAERELGFAPEFDEPYPAGAAPAAPVPPRDRGDAPAPPATEPPRASTPPLTGARVETGPPADPAAGEPAPVDPPAEPPPAPEPVAEVVDTAEVVETAEDVDAAEPAPEPPVEHTTSAEDAPVQDAPAGDATATTPDDPDAPHPCGIPVPPPPADAPPLPGTPAPSLRPPPPPPEDDDAAATDERPLPADPFPPPFRWSTTDEPDDTDGAGEASPDTTQVVRGAAGPAADRTQVVATGRAPEETQVVPARVVPTRSGPPPPPQGSGRPPVPPPERTQFVPGAVPVRAAGGGVARPEETAPPWASAAARSEGLQGRELFARGPGPRAGAVLGTVAVLLLVALVLVASFALA